MDANEPLPALRSLEITPFEGEDGRTHFALQDRSQIAPQAVAVSAAGYFVLVHLDGEHTCADVQAEFERQTGMRLPTEQVIGMVRALDEALLLEGERFEQAYATRRAEYLAAPARDNRARYPEADALRQEIEKILACGAAAPVSDVRGLIAPHLDYARGRPCYADAYTTLAKSTPAERYVILGANHAGRATSVVATTKDFQTPLGLVPADRAFIDRLESRLAGQVCAHELDHLFEHSVELQVHILQVIMGPRPFEIVPVLCSNPAEPAGAGSADPQGPTIAAFADALAELLAVADRRTVVIAGADLSHVGESFGDAEPATPETLAGVGRADRELLSLLESRAEDAFVERLAASGNPTRICSAGCLYALLRALPDLPCRLLTYHQAADYEQDVHVTCAAAVIG